MTETIYTPGPWTAKGVIVWADPVPLQDGGTYHRPIADCKVEGVVTGSINNEANARLIAAAPDMLEALRKAEGWLAEWASAEPYIGEIRAAIAKATGAS